MDSISVTPTTLKALSHPIRISLLSLLRSEGPATSSQLADVLDTSSGLTSYHLRELAKHGFISEDPERGTGREKYWIANHLYTELERSNLEDDPDALALYDEFVRLGSRRREAEVMEWLRSSDDWGPDWAAAAAIDDHTLVATPSELAALREQVSDLLSAYATRSADEAPEGASMVVAHFLAFPVPSLRPSIGRPGGIGVSDE